MTIVCVEVDLAKHGRAPQGGSESPTVQLRQRNRPPPIDWPHLLHDMAYLLGDELPGTSAREPAPLGTLAAFLAVPRSTLRGWLEGAEPRHNDGEALLMRWCTRTGKAPAFAPLLRRGGNPTGQVQRR